MSKTAKAARQAKRKATGAATPKPVSAIPAETVRQALRNLAIFATRAPTRDMNESDARAQSMRIVAQHYGIPLPELLGRGAPPPAAQPKDTPDTKDGSKAA